MFPWRTVLSLASFAFLFAFFASELGHRPSVYSAKDVRRKHGADASMSFFGARPPVMKDELQYDSGLHKRDVCNDTFPGRYSQTCEPSKTLCCIIPGENKPACTVILGLGFCCTEHTDCFVDLNTACSDSGSTQCAPGLCCPAQTSCVSGFNYTTTNLVRCNANRNLIPGYTSSSSSASSTATRSASGTSSASGTAASITNGPTSAVPTNTSTTSKGLSGGAIAGIVIGALAAVVIIAVAGWLLYRKSKNSSAPATQNPHLQYPQYPQELPEGQQLYEAPNGVGYHDASGQPKERYAHVEMPTYERRQELP